MNDMLIRTVISTLCEIEVKGKGNLSKLLGSINALESMLAQPQQEEVKPDGNTD